MTPTPTITKLTGRINRALAAVNVIAIAIALSSACTLLLAPSAHAQVPTAPETNTESQPGFRGHHIRLESTSAAAEIRDTLRQQVAQCQLRGLSPRMPETSDLREYALAVTDRYYTQHRMTEYLTTSILLLQPDCTRFEKVVRESAKVVGTQGVCKLNIQRRKAEGACTEDRFPLQGPTSFNDPLHRTVGTMNILGHTCIHKVTQREQVTAETCLLERKDPWLQTEVQQANQFLILRRVLKAKDGYHTESTATLVDLNVMIPWSVSMPHLARGYTLSDPAGDAKRR